ncbi:hypothetical protein KM043_009659 [Ampulex compressa]|nr:hypothetical protein KM043_009659 [Ampulex compressa]
MEDQYGFWRSCQSVRPVLRPSSLTEFVRFSSFGDSRRWALCERRATGHQGVEQRGPRKVAADGEREGSPRRQGPGILAGLLRESQRRQNVLIKATQIAGALVAYPPT